MAPEYTLFVYFGLINTSTLIAKVEFARTISQNKPEIHEVFIGIHATFSDGVYASIEGVPLEEMPVKWNEGKPNNYRKQEQCAALFHNGIGDTSCENYFPYICYRKASVGDELTACGTVDKEYNLDARTGQCYKLHDQAETWQRAHMICQAEGAYLAIINSEAESEVLKQLTLENPVKMQYNKNFFIGFRKWGPSDAWWTVHGVTVKHAGFAQWPPGEPNNATHPTKHFHSQTCGSVSTDGKLNDMWCEVPSAFICEKNKHSLLFANYNTSEVY